MAGDQIDPNTNVLENSSDWGIKVLVFSSLIGVVSLIVAIICRGEEPPAKLKINKISNEDEKVAKSNYENTKKPDVMLIEEVI